MMFSKRNNNIKSPPEIERIFYKDDIIKTIEILSIGIMAVTASINLINIAKRHKREKAKKK